MLRKSLLGLGTGCLIAALVLAFRGNHPAALPLAINGAALTAGIIFERWRYRQAPLDGGTRWQETDERFIDPESGKTLKVQFDPASGIRRYVEI